MPDTSTLPFRLVEAKRVRLLQLRSSRKVVPGKFQENTASKSRLNLLRNGSGSTTQQIDAFWLLCLFNFDSGKYTRHQYIHNWSKISSFSVTYINDGNAYPSRNYARNRQNAVLRELEQRVHLAVHNCHVSLTSQTSSKILLGKRHFEYCKKEHTSRDLAETKTQIRAGENKAEKTRNKPGER